MSVSQKKWFKSAFSQEFKRDEPPEKKARSLSVSESCNMYNESILNDIKQNFQTSSPNKKTYVGPSNWMENFSPSSVQDLAIHAKKISEVKDWFLHCEAIKSKHPAQILLITGPSGCGKTATVKIIANEIEYDLVEWVTPLDIDLVNQRDESTFKESQVEIFKGFLFRSARYKSVFGYQGKRIILVEDFPNVFINDSESFNDILETYHSYGKSPLIFITTDSKSKQLNIAQNLFPDHVRLQFNIAHISFNPVSTTLMKRALKRVCTLMTQNGYKDLYKVPSSEVVDSINLSSQGDIRNAIINLHFASQKGTSQLEMQLQKQTLKTKYPKKNKKVKGIGRDESITFMHALGRVFNPKYLEEKRLVHSPEDITNSFYSEPKNFVNFIHANYLNHFSSIDHVVCAIDSISHSDVLLNEYRENELCRLGLNVAIRGVMVCNENPTTGWMPVKGPNRMKNENNLDYELKSLGIETSVTRSILASDYRTYAKIIKSV